MTEVEHLIRDCQADLAAYLPSDGISARECIQRLLERLDGPQGRQALAELSADPVATLAPSAFSDDATRGLR